jgi:hypothetical protein
MMHAATADAVLATVCCRHSMQLAFCSNLKQLPQHSGDMLSTIQSVRCQWAPLAAMDAFLCTSTIDLSHFRQMG